MLKTLYFSLKRVLLPGFKLDIEKDTYDNRDVTVKLIDSSARKIDMSKYCPLIKHQGRSGSCGSHAGVTWFEMMMKMKGITLLDEDPLFEGLGFSEFFHYYYARVMRGSFPQDSGQSVRDIFKTMKNYGNCPEMLHRKKWSNMNVKPDIDAEKWAKTIMNWWQLLTYEKISNAEELKNVLLNNRPAVLGVYCRPNFMKLQNYIGRIIGDEGGIKKGGHAILIVGFDKNKGFLVHNSWGTQWKDYGYCWLSKGYIDKNWIDCWTGTIKIKNL